MFLMLFMLLFILLPNSIAAIIVAALTCPIPSILIKVFIFISLNSFILSISFNIFKAKSFDEYFVVPVFINIASNSSVDKFFAFSFINLSIGLSFSGKSFILFSYNQLLVFSKYLRTYCFYCINIISSF